MDRDLKKDFKEIVKVASPKERIWMFGFLEAIVEEGYTEPPNNTDSGKDLPAKKESEAAIEAKKAVTQKQTQSSNNGGSQAAGSASKTDSSYISMATLVAPDQNKSNVAVLQKTGSESIKTATIVFGTETGNSKKLASVLQNRLKAIGVKAKVSSTNQYNPKDLDKEDLLLTIISTHGDGDPPEAARKFHESLKNRTESLPKLKYSVLALGDTSYPLFCKAGEDVDVFLDRLQATRILNIAMCDVDYEATADEWMDAICNLLSSGIATSISQGSQDNQEPSSLTVSRNNENGIHPADANENGKLQNGISKASTRKFYTGIITKSFDLTDAAASKIIRHIEIESDEEIEYLPGDSAGFIPKNDPKEVSAILRGLRLNGEDTITWRKETLNLQTLLEEKASIRYLSKRVMESLEAITRKKLPNARLDLIDIVQNYPPHDSISKESILEILEPITPRYYSISSSPEAQGKNSIHLTVAEVDFKTAQGKTQKGFCSDYLFELMEGSIVNFRIQKNDNFRIPAPNANAIYIGPGTGIAPFRSFLFERDSLGHTGKNWLFFGNRNFSYDFLYQTELLEFFDSGVLTKFNTAFSRDNSKKVYVQDRIRENGKELVEWLDAGAILYICGSKEPMSYDVDKTLIEIFMKEKNLKKSEAEQFLSNLIDTERYKKDVY